MVKTTLVVRAVSAKLIPLDARRKVNVIVSVTGATNAMTARLSATFPRRELMILVPVIGAENPCYASCDPLVRVETPLPKLKPSNNSVVIVATPDDQSMSCDAAGPVGPAPPIGPVAPAGPA